MSMPRKIRCSVAAITDHGESVYSLELAPASPVPQFRPGQFLHLTVNEYEPSSFWPESRVFSIASSPRDRRRIRICYSVKGRYTKQMEQTLRPGSEVWIKLPYGDFVVDHASEAVLFAGGTGISAFTAFVEALGPESSRSVTLVYGARTPDLFLFQEMILAQHARVPRFQLLLFSESADAAFERKLASLTKPVRFLPGRITLEPVWACAGPLGERVFYLSGPPAMLTALGTGLRLRGVAPERIRTDAWE
jgi:ferredoxin-NADP reductase